VRKKKQLKNLALLLVRRARCDVQAKRCPAKRSLT